MAEAVKKEKKRHIVRKQNVGPSFKFFVRFLSVLSSLLIIVLLFTLVGQFNPGQTISYLFNGAFGNNTNFNQTLLNMMMMLVLALGLAPTFRMKYWNTGALGQALIGNLCSSLIVFYLGKYIPNNFLLLTLALAAAMVGGAIWGIIPGIFKAKLKANETLFTLMMNYVAIQLVLIFIEIMKQGAKSLAAFTTGAFDNLLGMRYGWVFLITLLVAIFVFIYLKFSKHGYELAVLGESENTAKYAGIDTLKVTIRTAALSGAICAICGFIYTGTSNNLNIASDGGYGFTSIIITWTSHFSILAMAIVSFIIAFLKKGADGVKNKASDRMNDYASYIAIGIFLFLIIGCEFFLNYKFAANSKFAQKQEARKAKLRQDYPKLMKFFDDVHNWFKNTFSSVDYFLINLKRIVFGFIGKCYRAIKNFFKRIFTCKNKEVE